MATYAKSMDVLLNQLRSALGSLIAGTVTFYEPGSTTLASVYMDRGKQEQAANPYTLSADGQAELFGDGLYRVVLKNASGVTIYDWDNLEFIDAQGTAEESIRDFEELNYRNTLGLLSFSKMYFDTFTAFGTVTLGGTVTPSYNAADTSYSGVSGSTITTPIMFEVTTPQTRAYLLDSKDDISFTREFSVDSGETWIEIAAGGNIYYPDGFTQMQLRYTWGSSGKLYSFGLAYSLYAADYVTSNNFYYSVNYDTLAEAITAIGSTDNSTLIINSAIPVGSTSQVIPSNVAVTMQNGYPINLNAALTINGPFDCGLFQAFTGASSVTFGSGSIRYYEPKWFNNTTQPPVANGFAVGTITKNLTPSVGNPKGWVCTVAGTPGTWVSEGDL